MKKNFLYNFFLTGSNFLFPLLTFPYLSRIIGAEGLGICNFIISYAQNYIILGALGIQVYGVREIAKIGDDKEKRSKLFFELLFIHLAFTLFLVVVYLFSVFAQAELHDYKTLALLGGLMIFLNVFAVEWLFAGVNDFKYITIRSVIIRALSVIAVFVFVRQKEDFPIYFVIITVTIFLTVLVDIYSAKKFITKHITLTFKGILSHSKPMVVLGGYIVLTNVYTVLPTTLLGFMSTKAAVGYYYGANRIIRMVISIFSSLVTVMIPPLNLIVEQNDEAKFHDLIHKVLNIVISFGIPISFLVFLLADPIVMLLAGEGFVNSIIVIRIMAPVILIVAFAQVFVMLILSVNRKDKEMVLLSFFGMGISLAINIIFIPYFAEKATGFSQLFAELFVTVISFFIIRRFWNLKFPIVKFLLNAICVIPFALITYFSLQIFDQSIFQLILSGTVCALYFFFYQFYILKDQFLIELIAPYLVKLNFKTSLSK